MNGKLKALVLVAAAGGAGLAVRAVKQARRPDPAIDQAGREGAGEVGSHEPSQSDAATPDLTYREPTQSHAATPDPTYREPIRFQGSTRDELYQEAKRRGIPGRSRMTKAELQAALEKETGSWARKQTPESE